MKNISNKDYLKIIQITDTHLFSKDDAKIYGVQSNFTFKKVINSVFKNEINNLDYIFLTGDLSQDESLESYQIIADELSKIKIPVYWIPGNHDHVDKMKLVFNQMDNFYFADNLILDHWHFIFLNTKLEKSNKGFLIESEMNKLEKEIKILSNKSKVIIMHHHPIEVQTPLIDKYSLQNQNEFWQLLSGKNIHLIVCGHVHGDYSLVHNNVFIETAPATCLQWQKNTSELNFDYRIGFKVYYFYKDCYKSDAKIWSIE